MLSFFFPLQGFLLKSGRNFKISSSHAFYIQILLMCCSVIEFHRASHASIAEIKPSALTSSITTHFYSVTFISHGCQVATKNILSHSQISSSALCEITHLKQLSILHERITKWSVCYET